MHSNQYFQLCINTFSKLFAANTSADSLPFYIHTAPLRRSKEYSFTKKLFNQQYYKSSKIQEVLVIINIPVRQSGQ